MEARLTELEPGVVAKITRVEGGHGFQRRLRTRGLREGRSVSLVTRQPGGPIVVRIGGTQFSIGRGVARKVIVEV
ncbi:hypothetical protein AKJ51_02935 [candidate division MSBL1 archaeon SCGC-AAA382A20]|uniref:Ferrous iron transporter FeoA-like domain-containing protein n=1 Tax=candidate division MSBL1 archaeon SCGC-AAA382A20 TaxID=1698280 RepID=A0A133VK00_9EURY|nr:hypothetical protein AKJ51_02935 [candidate division MSBL1 archaeon SCGC-AAA382A20]